MPRTLRTASAPQPTAANAPSVVPVEANAAFSLAMSNVDAAVTSLTLICITVRVFGPKPTFGPQWPPVLVRSGAPP